jgi:general secretion pathway protein B
MSYILDALRRADAERQQGQVPGLHAAPAGGASERPRAGRPAWVWLALAVLGVLAALLLWLWWPRPAAVPTVASTAPVALSPPRVSSAPEPVVAALPIVVSAAPAPPADARAAEALTSAPGAVPASAASKPAAAAVRSVPLAALPPDERRQLPPLVTGGSVWSDTAASRFVILDGQVLREGDAVAAGLVLERIERKAAVLRWKEQRLEVPL